MIRTLRQVLVGRSVAPDTTHVHEPQAARSRRLLGLSLALGLLTPWPASAGERSETAIALQLWTVTQAVAEVRAFHARPGTGAEAAICLKALGPDQFRTFAGELVTQAYKPEEVAGLDRFLNTTLGQKALQLQLAELRATMSPPRPGQAAGTAPVIAFTQAEQKALSAWPRELVLLRHGLNRQKNVQAQLQDHVRARIQACNTTAQANALDAEAMQSLRLSHAQSHPGLLNAFQCLARQHREPDAQQAVQAARQAYLDLHQQIEQVSQARLLKPGMEALSQAYAQIPRSAVSSSDAAACENLGLQIEALRQDIERPSDSPAR